MVVLVVHELRIFACTCTCCVAADCLYSVSSACLVTTIFIIPAAVVFHKPAGLLPRVESVCTQQRNFLLYRYSEVGIANFFLSPLIASPLIFLSPLNANPLTSPQNQSANR